MSLAIASKMSYDDVLMMSHSEREILYEVLVEKAEAENPKSKNQQKMVPGEINGPPQPQMPRQEPR